MSSSCKENIKKNVAIDFLMLFYCSYHELSETHGTQKTFTSELHELTHDARLREDFAITSILRTAKELIVTQNNILTFVSG